MEFSFRNFLEAQTGRAAEKFWLPATPLVQSHEPIQQSVNKHLKGVHLDAGFKPLYPAPFKGLKPEDLGYKIKKVPKIKK